MKNETIYLVKHPAGNGVFKINEARTAAMISVNGSWESFDLEPDCDDQEYRDCVQSQIDRNPYRDAFTGAVITDQLVA